MKKKLKKILIKVANKEIHYNLAHRQILNLFSVSGNAFRIDKYGKICEAEENENPCDKCKYQSNLRSDICKHCLINNDVDSEYYT